MGHDFLAIGDTVVDDFIRLKDAHVHCDINSDNCTISMRWGDKIPFESSTKVYGVGNAANAAVSAARLGLKTAFISGTGKDQNGNEIVKSFKRERVDTRFIKQHRDIETNYHYVLWYGDERSILVNQSHYPFTGVHGVPIPKTVYLSSLVDETGSYHDEVAAWLEKHPDIFLAFQPGVFEMKMGTERLARLYKRANIFFANKEEYQRVLDTQETDPKALLEKMHMLGVKTPVLTDGREGVNALDNGQIIHVPMFPDPKPPFERTGAGDAFSSTTAAFLTLGLPLKDAMIRGTINSAYVVQKIGAQEGLLTRKELESKL